ncbi:hypothetical protein FACS1894202_03470 [Clostridia bacterium]|nr:hypothetical protein FACS1894202_03470 [Clostridia bacterium]
MTAKVVKIDWLAMKRYWLHILIVPVMLTAFGFTMSIALIPLAVFAFAGYATNPFAVEEKGKLDHLYLTLPVSRRSIVNGRYALSLIMLAAAYAVGIPAMLLFSGGNIRFGEIYFGVSFSMVALICSFAFAFYGLLNISMLPILFRIGYAKGKAIGFYIPVIVVGLLFGALTGYITSSDAAIQKTLEVVQYALEHIALTCAGFVAAGLILLVVSYVLSVRVYEKRSF